MTVEEHSIYGGLGGAVAEVLAEYGKSIHFRRIGLTDFVEGYGGVDDVRRENGLGRNELLTQVMDLMSR